MKKAKIAPTLWQWKALEYLAYLTAILVPLVMSQRNLFGFTSIKSFVFMACLAGMTTLYVWGKYREIQKGDGSLTITWLHAPLALFAVALGASAVFAVAPHTSWFGSFQQGTGLVFIYAFIVWSILIGSLVRRSESFFVSFLGITFATGVLAALLIAFKSSTIGNSSFEGAYLLFIACIGLGLFVYHQSLWKRLLVAGGMLVVLLSPVLFSAEVLKGGISFTSALKNPTLFVGEAKGAVLGMFIAFIVASGLFLIRSAKNYKRIAGAVLCIAVIIGTAIAGWQLMTPGTLVNSAFVKQTSATRFVYWDIAAAGFLSSPIIGYGWGNYDRVYQEYFDPILFTPGYAAEPSLQDPHNAIWSYMSTTGILGLMAYILLIGGTFVVLYCTSHSSEKAKRIFGVVLAGSIVGYFLQNMFVFDTPVSYLLLFSVIGVGTGMASVKWSTALSKRHSGIYAVIAVLGVSVAVACLIMFSILPLKESTLWYKQITDSSYSAATSPQHLSVVGNANDTAYIATVFYKKTKNSADFEKRKELYEKKYQLLVQDLAYDVAQNQSNYKPYLVKGVLENGLVSLSGTPDEGLLASAQASLERAQILNPHTPEVYFNLAQTALYRRDIEMARAYIRAGIATVPANGQGYVLAEALQKIAPSKEFWAYVERMRTAANK